MTEKQRPPDEIKTEALADAAPIPEDRPEGNRPKDSIRTEHIEHGQRDED